MLYTLLLLQVEVFFFFFFFFFFFCCGLNFLYGYYISRVEMSRGFSRVLNFALFLTIEKNAKLSIN